MDQMEAEKLTERVITQYVKEYLIHKTNGNWHADKVKQSDGYSHGANLILVGGKRNSEYFIIECKGKSYVYVQKRKLAQLLEKLYT